jgi:serine/threonine-protein kinase
MRDNEGALEPYRKALSIAPSDVATRGIGQCEQALGHWDRAIDMFRQSARLDPRGAGNLYALANALLRTRHTVEAREVFDRELDLSPSLLAVIEHRATTFLQQGDLPGARASLQASAAHVEPVALIAYLASYYDLVWVLDDSQRQLLMRLTPSAFDDDRGTWGLALAQGDALNKDAAGIRLHAGEAIKTLEGQLRSTPEDAGLHATLGVALAYLGRKEDAIREGQRAVAIRPVSKDASTGPYYQHLLARIYVLTGEPEKAIDQLEPLLKVPYYLTPGWLRIDPSFDPLRGNPRFERLAAG